jgi:hypothetical protein
MSKSIEIAQYQLGDSIPVLFRHGPSRSRFCMWVCFSPDIRKFWRDASQFKGRRPDAAKQVVHVCHHDHGMSVWD